MSIVYMCAGSEAKFIAVFIKFHLVGIQNVAGRLVFQSVWLAWCHGVVPSMDVFFYIINYAHDSDSMKYQEGKLIEMNVLSVL